MPHTGSSSKAGLVFYVEISGVRCTTRILPAVTLILHVKSVLLSHLTAEVALSTRIARSMPDVSPPADAKFPASTNRAPRFRVIFGNCLSKSL
jgi:hypothetical protein